MPITKIIDLNSLGRIVIVGFLISLVLALSSCSQQQESFKKTEENYHSTDIRSVVLPLFSKYKYPNEESGTGNVMPFSEVPKEIKSLPVFSMIPTNELFVMTAWASTNGDAILFAAGSGFGHWGLAVCKNENDREFDGIPGYTYWENGVYFYNGN